MDKENLENIAECDTVSSPESDAVKFSLNRGKSGTKTKRRDSIESTCTIDGYISARGADSDSSFVEPSPRKSLRLLKRISSTTSFDLNILSRKRKRKEIEDDNVSVQSFNVQSGGDGSHSVAEKKSKRMSMKRMSSLVNMFSPSHNKVGKALERSFSFKAPNSPVASSVTTRQITPYKKPKPASGERRASKFWSETVDMETRTSITSKEFKRQEAIFELVQGEQDLIEDLTMVHKLYHNSMKKLKLMTDEELDSIFGIVERLVPFHEDLLKQLQSLRQSDGTMNEIGTTFLSWIPNLRQYETYCANQVFAKGLLDYKKCDPKVDDFLNRCQESSFSRKLDLWNFLDLPRSRLVKYPLLLKQIYKQTDDEHPDKETLEQAIGQVEEIIKEVDTQMGASKCKYAIQSLEFLYDSQKSDLIDQSTSVLCSGQLKNDRGTKLHVFLFDKVLVVTRQATRNGVLRYQVLKDPVPLSELELIDLSETEGRRGSFKKKVLRQPVSDKYAFRISNPTSSNKQTHILHAREEHDKRQWISCIIKAMQKEGNSNDGTQTQNSEVDMTSCKSNTSSSSSLGSLKSDNDSIPEESTERDLNLGPESVEVTQTELVDNNNGNLETEV